MPMHNIRIVPVILLTACLSEAIGGPPAATDVSIRVVAAGGITGSIYTFEIDGAEGIVRAIDCSGICPADPGTVIIPLSDYQIRRLAEALEDGGILSYDGRDFGADCCDQVAMSITYRSDRHSAAVSGTIGRYPEALREVVARIGMLGGGRVPAIIAFGTRAEDWPADPLTIEKDSIDGPILFLDVASGGGCARHSVDIVLNNGWLESFPVQVGAIASHDARADPCDAIVRSRRGFDLTPIRDAYREAYGDGPATVIIHLSAANGSRTIEYRF